MPTKRSASKRGSRTISRSPRNTNARSNTSRNRRGGYEDDSNYGTTARERRTENRAEKRQEFTLKEIEPKTFAQEQMMNAFDQGLNVAGIGSAGTGKSFVSLYLALEALNEGTHKKIIIVRSAVATRDIGALPGDITEKTAVFELPYVDIVNDLYQNGTAYEIMKKKGQLEFITTSYVRGLTFDNAIVIVDEFQSMNQHELFSIMTRLSDSSRLIVIGDTRQTDLNPKKEVSCFDWFKKVAERMPEYFDIVNFLPADIVRGGFCKKLIMVSEDM